SKIQLMFETYCLDPFYDIPDKDWPVVFSYEKVDMPLFSEVATYLMEHPDLDQGFAQQLVWGLSSDEQSKFEDFLEENQQLLLDIRPDAQEVVDSYEYYRNMSIRNFSFSEDLLEEVVPQPIPGTELYAKVTFAGGYSQTGIGVYNPSSKPQVFSIFKEDAGILAFVPKGWVKEVTVWKEAEELTFGVVTGKLDIAESVFRTPADSGVTVELEDGSQITIEPSTELSFDQFKQLVEGGAVSWWGRLLHDLFGPFPVGAWGRDKFQIRVPTMITGVRG
ncbi:unnamed protein product, partial [marine sediment metagenome]